MRKGISVCCAFAALLFVLSGCASYSRELREGVEAQAGGSAVCATIPAAEVPPLAGYDAVAGNDSLYLYVSPETLDVAVLDRRSGMVWTMIPEDWENDPYASGPTKMFQASGLVLEVIDDNMQTRTISGYADSVKPKRFTLRMRADGFEADYVFPSCGVELTVRYELLETGLRFSVVPESIVEGAQGKYLSRLWVAPFFGSAGLEEEGFLFMPDGSGAVMEFSGEPTVIRPQSQVVYGFDSAMTLSTAPALTLNYLLPVFGIKRNGGAMTAIITQGDAMARIVTTAAGQGAGRYRAYPVFTYRDVHNLILYEGQEKERVVNDFSPVPNSRMAVEYRFLAGNAGYAEMARDYREYLLDNGQIQQADTSFAMDLTLIGAVKNKRTVLGVPTEVVYPVTTFDQAVEILRALKEKGVDSINVTYLGANAGGLQNERLGQFSPEPDLGGAKALDRLLAYAEEHGVSIAIGSELVNVYRTGGAFSANKHGVRQLTGALSEQKIFNVVNGHVAGKYHILSPQYIPDFAGRFTASTPAGVSVSFRDLCGKLYSQFDTAAFITREEAKDYVTQTLSMLRETCGGLKTDGFNAYALPYAAFLSGLPDTATMTDAESRAVPFYQLAVSGLLPYSALTPGNTQANRRDGFLKQVEYGSFPKWMWGAIGSEKLQNAEYEGLYSLYYADWIEEAAGEYLELKALYDGTGGFAMVSHERLARDVYLTGFQNGAAVVVNYGDTDYISASGDLVPPKGYVLSAMTEGAAADGGK